MEFKFKYFQPGIIETSASLNNPEFLKHATQIIFCCLKNYEQKFPTLYFPLRRTHINKGIKKLKPLAKILEPKITGQTKASLHLKESWYSFEKSHTEKSTKINNMDIYLLSEGESISKTNATAPESNKSIPIKKSNSLELILPFGMLDKEGKFYENIVSLTPKIKENFKEINNGHSIIGADYEMANNILKKGIPYFTFVSQKRQFDPQPKLIIARGFLPDGTHYGTSSTISNLYVPAMQLFGVVSITPKAKCSEDFRNFLIRNEANFYLGEYSNLKL